MSGDLLTRAAGALRETAEASPADVDTFARVLREVRHRRGRRRRLGSVALAFALVVAACGAWAAATGRLAALERRVRPAPARSVLALVARGPKAGGPEVIPMEASPTAVRPEAPPPARLLEAPPHFVAHRPDSRRPASRRADDVAPPALSPDELYRDAHEAHFARRDFSTAVELWERYLAVIPLPRFAVEARYNRGIALLRLGRRDEAARALRPFVEGDYGSYRTREARALLGPAVEEPPAPP